jgi:phospholipid/cholesterol/gamma-HCH transport system substrate-binding protein
VARRANPTLIGAFVLAGIALAVGAVLLLGGREWFKRPVTCLMAFDGNVAGLTVGSPVSFRGVQLGTVSSIELRSGSPLIVVFVQLDPTRIRGVPGPITRPSVEHSIQVAVQNGLRAQLQVLSLLTGQLYVGLDYHPDSPARLTGLEKDYCEIPTVPTALAQFQDQLKKLLAELEELPLKQIVETTARTMEGIERIVRAPELTRAVRSLDATMLDAQGLLRSISARVDPTARALQATLEQAQRTLDDVGRDLRALVANVDSQVKPLAANVESTSDATRTLMRDAQQTLRSIDDQLGPALTSLRAAAEAARDAMRKAETSLNQVDGVLDGNSSLGYQLVDALNELTRAARSLRALSEEIDRQPNVLFFGRGGTRD